MNFLYQRFKRNIQWNPGRIKDEARDRKIAQWQSG